ncbi:hypothetical protein [uncultured Flavobacterium sp.]|uniref:DUF6934 family protein n=1 Tax=uncultured Flavobacterium sp. TaxID=165435 RepID=UPI0025F17746|nr:hypothetical protein [uncultured Flavobacterium sp.]
MNLINNVYDLDGVTGEEIGVKGAYGYWFESTGKRVVEKLIAYTPAGKELVFGQQTDCFDFGFGDIDQNSGEIEDKVSSNNGDARKVLETVLSTIPDFFSREPAAIVKVGGSDSQTEFTENCMKECRTKKCLETKECRKKDRRINIYRSFVNDNYDRLIEEYEFFGSVALDEDDNKYLIEPYEVNKFYKIVLVRKKLIKFEA